MRLLSLLFAFYFACLACMTCADEVSVCNEEAQTIVAATAHADYNSSELSDWCSPLCQCHCCGAAIVPLPPVPAVVQVDVPAWNSGLRHPLLVVGAPTRASGAVWQPPQA